MATSVDTLDNPICEAPVQADMLATLVAKPRSRQMESYHYAWLAAHPDRTKAWLLARLKDGFDVHHVDGDHGNDDPKNLALMERSDHMRLHGVDLRDGALAVKKKIAETISRKRAARQAARTAQMDKVKLVPIHREDPEPVAWLTDDMRRIAAEMVSAGSTRREVSRKISEDFDIPWRAAKRLVPMTCG